MKVGLLRVVAAAGGLKEVVGPLENVGLLRAAPMEGGAAGLLEKAGLPRGALVTGRLAGVVGALENVGLPRGVSVTGGLDGVLGPLEIAAREDPPGDGDNPLGTRFVVGCRI